MTFTREELQLLLNLITANTGIYRTRLKSEKNLTQKEHVQSIVNARQALLNKLEEEMQRQPAC